MDSWRGMWLSEELNCSTGIVDGNEKCSTSKAYFNGGENYPPLVSNTQALERLDLMDLGFSDDIRKSSYSLSSEPSGEVFSDEIGTDSYGNFVGSSPFCQDKESGSRMLSNNNNQEFSLIDLKLGRLGDNCGGANINGEFSKANGVSAAPSTVSAKRTRSTTLYPQAPCCQVFGCNKDLSSYKGYYKRHKVCDVHTKTAKVVVDGIEQRFCQQCSRFHLLDEFDDGKRSCRRRLAAHNKRRRKPQLNSESGSRIIGFSSPFGFMETLPSVTADSGEGLADLPSGLEDINVGMATPITQKVSVIQQNSRALSLLSAQSPNVSSELLGASSSTNPLTSKSGHADSSHHSASVFRKSEQSGLHTPLIYSAEADHVEPTTFDPRDGDTVDRKLPGDGVSRGPDARNNSTNYHNPLGRGIILDLLQLSSHLQRVEQQRHSTESEAG